MRNDILLMTATVAPKHGTPNLARADPQARLDDYRQALEFYLETLAGTFSHLVFAENSNADVSPLRQLVDRRGLASTVTFYVKDGLDYPPHYDRGYGEFKLVDDVMSSLDVLREPSTIVWKVTGRYIIRNIAGIVRNTRPPFDLACNYRNYPKHWVDTYLIAWTPEAYARHLKGVYDRLKANVPGVKFGTAAEEMLRAYLDKREGLTIAPRFSITPEVRGRRAADNREYEDKRNMKYLLRRTASQFIPWLWI